METGRSADRAAQLQARLLSLKADDLAPPYIDPRVAAAVALGVVDFAKSPEGSGPFKELEALDEFDAGVLDDLQRLAETLIRVVDAFDVAPRSPNAVTVPQELDVDCRARRGELVDLLSTRAADKAGVARALSRVKQAYGPVDLAVDLRALAALVERHELDKELPVSTRALAHRLEDLLISHDTPELRESRRALRRVWAVFEETYRQLADVGRSLFSDDPEAMFPTLDAICDVERSARSASSSRAPASVLVERGLPMSRRSGVSSRRMRAVRKSIIDAPPTHVEVVLNGASDSNLWLGFSQDIAEGGIFLATYAPHPLGAPMELDVVVIDREPLRMAGVVHWLRPSSAGDDLPAGVGVRLTQLSPENAKVLQAFAAARTPIFYDD